MRLNKIFFFLIILLHGFILFSQDNEFPKTMYVTSKEGLNQRETPSLQSRKKGTFLFGTRIIVEERGQRVTIDGITNYWYKTYSSTECWVFGGYLSEELPLEAPVILGLWDDENNSRQYYYFDPDHSYREGYKETDMGVWGKWQLNGNTITLILDSAMNEIIIDPPDIEIVQITIINRSNIILTFQNNKRIRLRRNNDRW